MFRSKFVKFLIPILKRQVDSAPNFVSLFSFMKYKSSIIYLFYMFYKWKFLRFSSVRVKFCQIPYANFEMRSRFVSKICISLPVSWKITPLYFSSSDNIYFAQKEVIKMKIFETYECSGQNLSNFLCRFWNEESIPLHIVYHSSRFMKDYSSVLF